MREYQRERRRRLRVKRADELEVRLIKIENRIEALEKEVINGKEMSGLR